jgi:NADH-quinone oxidoreductase subunit F
MHPLIPKATPIDPEIDALVQSHGRRQEALLQVLRELNSQRGGLSQETLIHVAQSLGISLKRPEELATFYALLSTQPDQRDVIRLCDGIACWLKGSDQCREAIAANLENNNEWKVIRSSCLGLCDRAPAALVDDRQCGPLTPENAATLCSGWSGDAPNIAEPRAGETRLMLARAGRIDPLSIEEAIAGGAYQGFLNALEGSPEAVIAGVEAVGLRGMGGAGFPAGWKLRMAAHSPDQPKYLVCNADESEPLSFKDRVLLESDPHGVIEGMLLAGYAIGARQGILYIRGEYEPQARIMETAIKQAGDRGFLGDKINGSQFSFDIELHRGAGAYICGEETALLESLEGRRGEPRTRPPFPTTRGYHGKPTVVNNVETLRAVAAVFEHGIEKYLMVGSAEHPGTKLFSVLGSVRKPGIFEAPFGLTLRQIIDDFGGGMSDGAEFGFALVGGAAGPLAGADQLDATLAFPEKQEMKPHLPMGTGAVLVCDRSVSPVSVVKELIHFFASESCGKCTPCRIGTAEAERSLECLLSGDAGAADIARLGALARTLRNASFCGLGTSAALPLSSALDNFPEAFQRV